MAQHPPRAQRRFGGGLLAAGALAAMIAAGLAVFASPAAAAPDKYIEYAFLFADGHYEQGVATEMDWTIHGMTVHVSCSDSFLGPDGVAGGGDDGYSSVGMQPAHGTADPAVVWHWLLRWHTDRNGDPTSPQRSACEHGLPSLPTTTTVAPDPTTTTTAPDPTTTTTTAPDPTTTTAAPDPTTTTAAPDPTTTTLVADPTTTTTTAPDPTTTTLVADPTTTTTTAPEPPTTTTSAPVMVPTTSTTIIEVATTTTLVADPPPTTTTEPADLIQPAADGQATTTTTEAQPSPSTTEVTPVATETAAPPTTVEVLATVVAPVDGPPVSVAGRAVERDELARTGADLAPLLGLAAVALNVGGLSLLFGDRPSRHRR